MSDNPLNDFQWQQHPRADRWLRQWVDDFCDKCKFATDLRQRMLDETGTRLFDWVDHIAIPEPTETSDWNIDELLLELGYQLHESSEVGRWYEHEGATFFPVFVMPAGENGLVIRVENVTDFCFAHQLGEEHVVSDRQRQLRLAGVVGSEDLKHDLFVCERHGFSKCPYQNTVPLGPGINRHRRTLHDLDTRSRNHLESFVLREREFADLRDGFEFAKRKIQLAIDDLNVSWACDLFFAAERRYWESRNRAAQIQKARQDRLGLGWANHDHHTYRSSRRWFAELISVLELLGFHCREQFYAGDEAGWGAQVLEQPDCGIVIFADVDLSADELSGDFAHDGLTESSNLGTVGLWCALHGDSFLQAGMHHLECTFDFEIARKQLSELGISSMEPFSEFEYLKQAFTEGENWSVDPERVNRLESSGAISKKQAQEFIANGAIGSHLEILERNAGYKGFNQTGVSQIIEQTDPRKQQSNPV